jgi:2'-hydroxyisoflavone reductase
MRLLVLGGTRFLGRAIVDAALERGDEVTLFNRGRTNPELFPEAEKLSGDRARDLSALAGRDWDAVVDVAGYHPPVVELSAAALADQVGRYVFVSSISVYADHTVPPVEGAVVEELDGDPLANDDESYGARKAACERVVERVLGDRALIVRPGLIVGPHDPTDRFTYWPRRIAAGGRVVAPAGPDEPVQFIDVRDLGSWIVAAAASGLGGTFNATGETLSFGELLEECRRVTGSDAEIVWLAGAALLEAGVEPWTGLPLWLPAEYSAGHRVSVAKAVAAGLSFRPLADTIRDTLAWDHEREWPRAEGIGLAAEQEAALLRRAGRF